MDKLILNKNLTGYGVNKLSDGFRTARRERECQKVDVGKKSVKILKDKLMLWSYKEDVILSEEKVS